MPLLWILFGAFCGAAIAYTRCYYVDQENTKLRASLQSIRQQLLFGNVKSAVRHIDRVLEQECAA